MLYSLKIYHFTPLYTTATFFCPQGGLSGKVRLSIRIDLVTDRIAQRRWPSFVCNSKQTMYITGTYGKKLCSAVSLTCSQIKRIYSKATDGIYRVTPSSSTFHVCFSFTHYLMKLYQGRFILVVYGFPMTSSFNPVIMVDYR